MRTHLPRTLALITLAGIVLAFTGCGRNKGEPILVPTGIRPLVAQGSVTGEIVFDRTQAPDLVSPPYPMMWVELWRDSSRTGQEDTLVFARRENLAPGTTSFLVDSLGPGTYTVFGQANFFTRTSQPPVRVVSQAVDVGILELAIDGSDNPSEVHVLYDETLPPRTILPGNVRDTTGQMQAERLGLWTFPQPFSQPPVLSPGVHRLRFILNRARANPVNWAAASMDTIDAPFTHEPAERIEGLGRDFWIRVATPTQFAVTLDLRRRTISLSALPTPLTAASGSRSMKP